MDDAVIGIKKFPDMRLHEKNLINLLIVLREMNCIHSCYFSRVTTFSETEIDTI